MANPEWDIPKDANAGGLKIASAALHLRFHLDKRSNQNDERIWRNKSDEEFEAGV